MIKLIQNNYTSGREGNKPQFVVVHTYNGVGESLYNWFNTPSAGASAHYAVFKNGQYEQYVKNEDTAWHSGNWSANLVSIGIEHQDDGNPSDSVRTDALYETSAQLIASLYKQFEWDFTNKALIKPHKEFTSTGCPGGLDVDRIRNRVYGILNFKEDNMSVTINLIPEYVTDQHLYVVGYVDTLGKNLAWINMVNKGLTDVNVHIRKVATGEIVQSLIVKPNERCIPQMPAGLGEDLEVLADNQIFVSLRQVWTN